MIRIRFKGQGESGEWFSGLLSISQGHNGQPEPGYYISNSAGMPWAYKVDPETVEVINQSKVDSRFTFEKGWCPFEYKECIGIKCEIWVVEQEQGKDLGCAIRIQAEATRSATKYLHLNQERSADALHEISKTLLQILGQLKTRK